VLGLEPAEATLTIKGFATFVLPPPPNTLPPHRSMKYSDTRAGSRIAAVPECVCVCVCVCVCWTATCRFCRFEA
jgi:hypothetical protein